MSNNRIKGPAAATPTCMRCGGTVFELAELVPEGSNFILLSVQCKSCGGVVGVMDYLNVGDLLMRMRGEIKRLGESID